MGIKVRLLVALQRCWRCLEQRNSGLRRNSGALFLAEGRKDLYRFLIQELLQAGNNSVMGGSTVVERIDIVDRSTEMVDIVVLVGKIEVVDIVGIEVVGDGSSQELFELAVSSFAGCCMSLNYYFDFARRSL